VLLLDTEVAQAAARPHKCNTKYHELVARVEDESDNSDYLPVILNQMKLAEMTVSVNMRLPLTQATTSTPVHSC